jgi:integrase
VNEAPKRRRPKGEGSFRERKDRGYWEASIDVGKDPVTGKRRRRVLQAKTPSALRRKIADLRARSGGSIRPAAKGTVREFMERWLEHDVQPHKRPKTFEDYAGAWRHAAPVIGAMRLEKFDIDEVAQLYQALRKKGASANTIRRVGKVLTTAFKAAIRQRLYTRSNPFEIVERPVHRAAEARALAADEVRRLLKAAHDDRFEALWLLMVTGGLRVGEALALRWSDVDLKNGTLAVQQSASDVKGRAVIGPTKTHRSRRRVDLGRLAIDALKRRRVAADSEEYGSELIFPSSVGKTMLQSNLRRSHFYPLLERAELGHLRMHDLRHTMTSLGVAAGLVPKVLAERLGHTTTRLTEDRYAHVLPGLGAHAAAKIDDLLRGAPKKGASLRRRLRRVRPITQ